mgnify:CR=1 FL=1
MRQAEERYISLLTDFGFKRIFGTAPNKDLLINFLNALFKKEQVITDVKYLNSEKVGDVYTDRKAIKLQHVYVVALLNFDMQDEAFDKRKISHGVGLLDKKTKKVFNDKLTFKYVEIAKFDKPLDKLRTLYDKWLFALKNLSRLENRPKELRDKIFDKLFAEAEIAKFSRKELMEYEDSLKAYRDIKNSLDTAIEKGRAEGRAEGKAEANFETARKMLSDGLPNDVVMKYTGLSEDDLRDLNK